MTRADRLAFFTLKKVNEAIYRFGMIQDGDAIAVAVSGGKDSLGLLRLLRQRVVASPEKYRVAAIHVHGDARGPDSTPRNPALEEWLRSEETEYVIENMRLVAGQELPMSCQRCAWSRRRTLFEAARRLSCNKVAFAHTADDLIQTYLMNLFYHGRAQGLEPVREYFGGELKLIRPLIFVPETEMIRLAQACHFPEPPAACPQSDLSRRETVRRIIVEGQRHGRQVRTNLIRLAIAASQ